ncbi:tRNA uridine-5-carboxymethylaminomethyl(34) synthesis GTPase MnmE [bacterium]|nr:tRNA uridine-5-carboxymethylaminomethyl(34) synthesis GTPase MnmE [bacterium]
MLPDMSDTIVALATPSGEGGIAVIRLSGADSTSIASNVIENGVGETIENPRMMILKNLLDKNGGIIDNALVVYFKTPTTYTGEDVIEFHCHGGDFVSHKLIETLVSHGARRAEAGEFTMRAFLNGRIDLTQAEGILALITTGASPSHSRAVSLLRGGLKEKINSIRDKLLDIIAPFEAIIDHPEDDMDDEQSTVNPDILALIKKEIDDLAAGFVETSKLETGMKIAIVGRPNVGKSSLMNCLLMKRRVLVHDTPGTTRDVITEELMLGEGRFRIYDTAGLRDDAADIEREGIELTKEAIDEANAVIVVLDSSEPLSKEDAEILRNVSHKPLVICLNKSDKKSKLSVDEQPELFKSKSIIRVSALKGDGVDNLIDELKKLYSENVGEVESAIPLLKRHHGHLLKASDALEDAIEAIEILLAPDAIALDLRIALEEMLFITGESFDDILLNEIFSNFCVGK